jgi:predicted anti-sigma-YlaC factor YlaD
MTGRPWQLILSAPARKLMVFFIVFGVIVSIGANVLKATINSSFGSTTAAQATAAQVTAAATTVHNALDR